MSIDSEKATLRARCSEAWMLGERYAAQQSGVDVGGIAVAARNDVLRRLLDDHDRLTAELARLRRPKSTRMPQEWPETDGMGL